MTTAPTPLETFMADLEAQTAAEMREQQTYMTAKGTLRVNLDNVYVGRAEGRMALEELRRMGKKRSRAC